MIPQQEIPQELQARPQWVVWRKEVRDGKSTKVPYSVNGQRASTTDPSTWTTFEEAQKVSKRFDGIGFVFSKDDPFVGIDLDKCLENGGLHKAAGELVGRLGSYTELSPSGTGLHVFVKAELNGHRNRTSMTPWGGEIEFYQSGRYFTVTGRKINGAPDTIEKRQEQLDGILSDVFPPVPVAPRPVPIQGPIDIDDEALLEKARTARHGAEFVALFDHGKWEGPYVSQSEAELALCNQLAFWTGGDTGRMDSLFRASALMRPKWEREGSRTISKALAGRTEFYTPPSERATGTPKPIPPPQERAEIELDPSRFFTKEEGLVVSRLGEEIKAAGHLRLGHDDRLYRYHRGVYRSDGETFAQERTRALLGERFKKRHQQEVVAWLRSDFPSISERPDTNVINCANGLLEWRTGKLSPHTPDYPSLIQLPVEWDPAADCPRIDRFLDEVVPADAVPFMHELVAYLLLAGNPFRKAVLLLGPGHNGKSVFLNTVRALLGKSNCASVTLQAFGEQRFAPAQLYGKLANIAGDLDARAIKRTDMIKMATGNDAVMAEHKYGQPFTFVPFAVPLFSANEAPISADQTDAWFDRWLIVPFERRFTGAKDDPKLTEKLTTPEELSGLLAHSVGALARLMDRGRFEIPESVRAAGDVYRSKLDTVRAFVEEECVFDMDASTKRTELFLAYQEWTRAGGKWPVSDTNFYAHLARNWPGKVEEGKSHGARVIRGLRKRAVGE